MGPWTHHTAHMDISRGGHTLATGPQHRRGPVASRRPDVIDEARLFKKLQRQKAKVGLQPFPAGRHAAPSEEARKRARQNVNEHKKNVAWQEKAMAARGAAAAAAAAKVA